MTVALTTGKKVLGLRQELVKIGQFRKIRKSYIAIGGSFEDEGNTTVEMNYQSRNLNAIAVSLDFVPLRLGAMNLNLNQLFKCHFKKIGK